MMNSPDPISWFAQVNNDVIFTEKVNDLVCVTTYDVECPIIVDL